MSLGPDPEFRPLGGKAYGSIPHLPGSRTGAADRHLSHSHARICTERARDSHDLVVVLEKLDGLARSRAGGFVTPGLIHEGEPLSVEAAMARLADGGFHGAIDPVEGAVWRVERRTGDTSRVDFLAKYVRPDKVDGSLLPENTGRPAVWNWRPEPS